MTRLGQIGHQGADLHETGAYGAIRPRLSQFPTPGTWLDAVFNGPAALLEASCSAAAEVLAADVVLLGGIAVTKYRRVGRSVSLLFVGLSVLSVALVLAALT